MAEAWDDGSELSQPTTNTSSVINGGRTYGKGRGFIPLNNNNDNGSVGNNDGTGFGVNNNKNSSSGGSVGSGGWGFGRGGFHNRNDNDKDNNGLRGSSRGRQNDREGDNNEDTDNKGFRGSDGDRHNDRNVGGDDNYPSRGSGGRGGFAGFGNREEDGGGFGKKFNGDGEGNNNVDNDNKEFEGSAKHDYQPRGRGGRGGTRGEGRGGFAGFGNHEEDGGGFGKKFNGDGEDNNVNNDNKGFEGSAKHDYQPRGGGGRGGSRREGREGFGGFGNREEDGGGFGKKFNGDGEDNNVNNDNKGFEGSAKHDYQPRGGSGRGGSRGEGREGFAGFGNREEDGGDFGKKFNGDGKDNNNVNNDNKGFEGSVKHDYQPWGGGGRGGSRGEGRGGFAGFGNHEEDGGGFGKKFNGDGEDNNNVNNDNKGFEGSAKHYYQPRGGGGNRGGDRGSFINRNEAGNGESSGFGKKFNSDGDGDADKDSKPSRDRDGRERSDNNFVKEEDGENPDKPPPVTYIPPEISMDDDELFTGVDVGLNFSKYDEIKVTTTGVNFPGPIEDFKLMGLRNLVIDNIVKSGYKKPTPVQKHAMPIIMNGRDLMACAQTGSGKTAAFMVPIINDLLEHPSELKLIGGGCEPHCVVLLPTRELAVQIWRQALKFSKDSIIECCVIYGGVATMHQGNQVANGCHILVATPGRLLDFVERRRVSFASIRYVVLDEADRMLDMGFLESIQKMMNHESMVAKGDRQTLMFSATFGQAVQSIAAKFLDNYLFLTVGIVGAACSDVEQSFCEVTKQEKRQKLMELLENDAGNSIARTIVFVETKKHADVLASLLSEKKIPTTSIHGDRMQQQREEALRDFISGRMPVLVATAVAARGLDIKDVAHVINYDMPKEIDEYVHRIGRTGRVGNRGKATSFLNFETDGRIIGDLVRVLKSCGQTVPEWLLGGGAHCDSAGGATFGGQDVRSFGNDTSKAAEEEW